MIKAGLKVTAVTVGAVGYWPMTSAIMPPSIRSAAELMEGIWLPTRLRFTCTARVAGKVCLIVDLLHILVELTARFKVKSQDWDDACRLRNGRHVGG